MSEVFRQLAVQLIYKVYYTSYQVSFQFFFQLRERPFLFSQLPLGGVIVQQRSVNFKNLHVEKYFFTNSVLAKLQALNLQDYKKVLWDRYFSKILPNV